MKKSNIEVFANSNISLKEIDFEGIYTISSKSKRINNPYIEIDDNQAQFQKSDNDENIKPIELEANTDINLNLDLNFDFDEVKDTNTIENKLIANLTTSSSEKEENKQSDDMLNDFLSDFEIVEKE